MSNTTDLTYGQKAVGLTFNPSGSPLVNVIKEKYASLIDALDTQRQATDNPEVKRQYSVAITELQASQMWAVKAATWSH